MSTITIKNPPKSFIKEYWTEVEYKSLVLFLDKQRAKKMEKMYYNKQEDNYWPFSWAKEAINFLTRNRW